MSILKCATGLANGQPGHVLQVCIHSNERDTPASLLQPLMKALDVHSASGAHDVPSAPIDKFYERVLSKMVVPATSLEDQLACAGTSTATSPNKARVYKTKCLGKSTALQQISSLNIPLAEPDMSARCANAMRCTRLALLRAAK